MSRLGHLCLGVAVCLRHVPSAIVEVVRDRLAPARRGDDRGAELLEWAGVLILVAGVVAGLVALDLPDQVAGFVDEWIGKILSEPQDAGTG
jgi:hypothetical protein